MATIEKNRARDAILAHRDSIIQLTHDIHEHPELAFCEEYAAARITQFLEEAGFVVQRDIAGMPTAFAATTGHGPLHIAFCAEYDALPPACLYDRSKAPDLVEVWLSPERQNAPLRHACGHNLIAGAAIAAALGLRELADQVGLTITVFGTPGEELPGLPEPPDGRFAPGKITLLESGAFKGMHAMLMVHPFPTPFTVIIPTKCYQRLRAQFGKAEPNHCLMDVSALKRLEEALKQAIRSSNQVPALFVARPEGPDAGAQADILWVAPSFAGTRPVRDALCRCFEQAADVAGVSIQITEFASGATMRHDPLLSATFRRNSKILGRIRGKEAYIQEEVHQVFSSPKLPGLFRLFARLFPRLVTPDGLFMDRFPMDIAFGTDLANVSQVIPSIHPMIGVGGSNGPHVAEFTDDIDTDEAYRAMLDGGVALAWTALDAGTDPSLRAYLIQAASKRS